MFYEVKVTSILLGAGRRNRMEAPEKRCPRFAKRRSFFSRASWACFVVHAHPGTGVGSEELFFGRDIPGDGAAFAVMSQCLILCPCYEPSPTLEKRLAMQQVRFTEFLVSHATHRRLPARTSDASSSDTFVFRCAQFSVWRLSMGNNALRSSLP